MTWIRQIERGNAEEKLAKVYDEIKSKRGKVSNIMKAHSLHPDSMKLHMNLYLSIMYSETGLSREEKEMVAIIVSVANKCDYSINHHAEALNHYWNDEAKIDHLVRNFRTMDFNVRTFAILNYAEKLTVAPNYVEETDIRNLQLHGISDEEILHINLLVSYFNFVNRIAQGLGIDFTEEEMTGYKY